MAEYRGTVRQAKCRSTFYGSRIPKNTGLSPSKQAYDTFLRQISAFKRRRKYHRYIPVNPVVLRGRTKSTFTRITEALEHFRCSLGLGLHVFYRLVSEFITVPSGVKYYPLREIFCEDSIAYEQFIFRLGDVLPWITDLIERDFSRNSESEKVMKFCDELAKRKVSVSQVTFRSKDWYCSCAIREIGQKKGWNEEELLERIGRFYKRRIKKITPEMVLTDLIYHELDGIDIRVAEPRRRKRERIGRTKRPTHIDLIKKQDWYGDWLKEYKESIEHEKG